MVKVQLLGTGKAVAYLMPVDKITGMKNWNTGVIFKGRGNQIIILAFAAD